MYEKFSVQKRHRYNEKSAKNELLIDNWTKIWGVVQDIKSKLNKYEPNCVKKNFNEKIR